MAVKQQTSAPAARTASPWWLSALLAAGLFLIFLGERPFDHLSSLRTVCTGLGSLLVLGTTALRGLTFARSRSDRRRVELVFLLAHAGVLLALALYVTTTDFGNGLFGLDAAADAEAHRRFEVPMTVLWLIVMAASLVPLLLAEISLGAARRTRLDLHGNVPEGDDGAVESFRVRDMAGSGLTIALAMALLMVTCNVASQRNVRKDYSYFKTSSPGTATIEMAKSVSEPIRVLLFFPAVSEVKEEVRGYFKALDRAGGNLLIEEHDRMVSAELAKEYRVNTDGVVVLVRGDSHERVRINPDIQRARRTDLRELDGKVQAELLKLIRTKRVAYMTIGHGELNDAKSLGALAEQYPDAAASRFKTVLTELNYRVSNLGLQQGLGNEVPEDADLVVMLAPKRALFDEEMQALRRYVERGGALLIALDPVGEADLGPLAEVLGVQFSRVPITDDQHYMRQNMGLADRRVIKTNQFSSHSSVTTLSRRQAEEALVFVNAGSLDDAPTTGPAPKKTYVIRSMSGSFADHNGNLTFDADTEQRKSYNLAAAIEAEPAKGDGGEEGKGLRAFVVADAELFSDTVMLRLFLAEQLARDAIKWLGGEERYAGETVSEKDVYIEHTKSEDVVWFYSTIVGAPLLVLGLGLGIVGWRRRRSRGRTS